MNRIGDPLRYSVRFIDNIISKVWTWILANDGTGSGLDADTLDGVEGSGYATSSHTHTLDGLSDVVVTTPSDNEVLAYDTGSGTWINQTLAYTLSGLSDTTITTPSDGDLLVYDSGTSKWVNDANPITTSHLASPTGSDTNIVTGTAGSANDQAVWDANGDVVGLTVAAFSAYHSSSQNTGNGSFSSNSYDTEEYDYGSNFASNAFTAPVNGVYHFDALARLTATFSSVGIAFYVDTGSGYVQVKRTYVQAGGSGTTMSVHADLLLSSGDSVKVYTYGNSAISMGSGGNAQYFNGHLIRQT